MSAGHRRRSRGRGARRSAWSSTLALVLVPVLVAVAACSSDDDEPAEEDVAETTTTATTVVTTPAPTTTAAPEPFQIGVVAPSAEDDLSITQGLADSLGRLDADRPIARTFSTDVPDRDAAIAELTRFAEDGLDLVVGHGAEFAAAVRQVAAEHPDVAFAFGPSTVLPELPNVFTYDARSDQGAFVMGAMAAELSTTGVVGAIGSVPVADVDRFVEGFGAGAVTTRPDVRAETTYIDSFDDETLAQDAARTVSDRGADVLTATSQMSVAAAAVAEERGALWFGNHVDQAVVAPANVVASQVYRWEVAFGELVGLVEQGVLGGGHVELTVENGGLQLAFNDQVVDAEVRSLAEELLAGIAAGTVATGID